LTTEKAGVPCNGLNSPLPPSDPNDPANDLCREKSGADHKETYVVKCDIGTPCAIPQAQAYDHHDGSLDVERTIYLVNDDGHSVPGGAEEVDYSQINWQDRAEFLVKYSAEDSSGNSAERLFLGMVVDDPLGPDIQLANSYPTTVEACDSDDANVEVGNQWVWSVPVDGVDATDNVDGDVGTTLTVEPTSFDTRVLGTMDIAFEAHDHAGMFGLDGGDNLGNMTTSIAVVDTTPPELYCKSSGSTQLPWPAVHQADVTIRELIAESTTISVGSGQAETFESCCAMCEEQQWKRRVGSQTSETACGSVNYNPSTRSCLLKAYVVDEDSANQTPSGGSASAQSQYGYPDQCQLANTMHCNRGSGGIADAGVRCIDFHDSLNLDLPAPHLDDTSLAGQVTITGEGDSFHCAGGSPYELFGPGTADASTANYHDLDHTTITFTRCGDQNWRFDTAASTDTEISDTGCNSCGEKLALVDDNCAERTIGAFEYFGVTYTSVHVCSNGFLQFGGEPNSNYNENVEDFVANVMIAGVWDDLHPGEDTSDSKDVFHETDGTLEKFRWHMLPEYQAGGQNTFMITLDTTDGSVIISHNLIDAIDGLVGLSSGESGVFNVEHVPVNFKANTGSAASSDTFVMTGALNQVGNFTISYTCADMGGLETTTTRGFEVVDTSPPALSLIGSHTVEFSAWQTSEHFYSMTDASSATCEDACDGTLPPQVVVYENTCGGPHACYDEHGAQYTCDPVPDSPVVDLNTAATTPGTYAIKYSCGDSASNDAVPQCRTLLNMDMFDCQVGDFTSEQCVADSGFGGSFENYYQSRPIIREVQQNGEDCPYLAEYCDQLPGARAGLFIPGTTGSDVTSGLLGQWEGMIEAAAGADIDGDSGWQIALVQAPVAQNSGTTDPSGYAIESFDTDGNTEGVNLLISQCFLTDPNLEDAPPTPPALLYCLRLAVRADGHTSGDISYSALENYRTHITTALGYTDSTSPTHVVNITTSDDNGAAVVNADFNADSLSLITAMLDADQLASARALLVAAVGSDETQLDQFVWPSYVTFCDAPIQIGLPVDCVWSEYVADCSTLPASCSDGTALGTRSKATPDKYGGAFCMGQTEEYQVCPATVPDCQCYTSYTEWSGCPVCGTGAFLEERSGVDKHPEWQVECAATESRPCSNMPSCTVAPTASPTTEPPPPPTEFPTATPTASPTEKGYTNAPTNVPTAFPSASPSKFPTAMPTTTPTTAPTTKNTTNAPTWSPTPQPPTDPPTEAPTASPTNVGDTNSPTSAPTYPQCETPIIQMVGSDIVSLEAGVGFLCNDQCDCTEDTGPPLYAYEEIGVNCSSQHGDLGVVSSWSNTPDNLPADAKNMGAWEIEYTCTSITDCGEDDLRGATPLMRTVIVQYTSAPHCHAFGQDTVNVEADFPYADAGACFYDSYQGKIASTEVSQLPVVTKHEFADVCVAGGSGGAPYELFGPGDGVNDMNVGNFEAGDHNYHDLDHKTITFKLCNAATWNWGFYSATSTDEQIADVGCENCGDKLGLGDDTCVVRSIGAFTYFGITYTSVHVCSNGFLQFGPLAGTLAALGERHYENAEEFVSRVMIAGIWDDLAPGENATDGKDIFHESVGELEKFRWHMLPEYVSVGANTLMVVLNTTDGGIVISHNNIDATDGLVGLSSGSGSMDGHVSVNLATGASTTNSNPTEDMRLESIYHGTVDGASFPVTIDTTENVDTSTVGAYFVTYSVTNPLPDFSDWTTHSCVRTVNVVDTLKPVISITHQGYHIQPDITPDVSTADVPVENPAQHFAANPGTRSAVNYDSTTELGESPYLVEQEVVASYSECKQRCETTAACTYGTYITEGSRQGECWLAATTSKVSRACGVPCKSFIVVDDDPNTQFRRRLGAMLRGESSRLGSAGFDGAFVAAISMAVVALAAVAVLGRKQASEENRVTEEWTAC